MYPNPINCLDIPYCDNYLFDHYKFWPDRDGWGDIEVLIAGCGTNQAACFAYHNPDLKVVGIDVSAASLAHENFLKKDYGIENLALHQLAIEDAGSLGKEFDLIFSHGVLHHLENPALGLRALKEVLHRDGSMHLMLYGKNRRVGVEMLQNMFRMIGLTQEKSDVEMVKTALNYLPQGHPAECWIKGSPDMRFDGGIVDTFLHKRDVAYTAEDCLAFLEACDLDFQGWDINSYYYPDAHIPRNNPLYKAINGLPERDMWQAMDLFVGIANHQFLACRKDRRANWRITFEGDEFLEYIPIKRMNLMTRTGTLKLNTMNYFEIHFFRACDGKRTVAECIDKTGIAGNRKILENKARAFISHLWRIGFVYLKIPSNL